MCRTALGRALILAGALGCPIALASAQDVRMYERRVDSLTRVWRGSVAARAAFEESIRRDYKSYDTVNAGPMHLLVEPRLSTLARRAADSAVTSLQPMYGNALEELRRHTLVVRHERVSDIGYSDTSYILIAELTNAKELFPSVVVPEARIVAGRLQDAALKILLRATDRTFANWLFTQLPIDTVASSEWSRTRVDLLSSQAVVARRCYAGNIPDCRLTLGLTEAADPVVDLFDAADRRKIVEEMRRNWWGRIDAAAGDECLAGKDAQCIAVLRGPYFRPPVAAEHHLNIVRLAIALGGPKAMERMLTTKGSIDDRIAAAARVPTDSVLRVWVARARDTRNASADMSLGIAATSFGWILICGAMAFRGSRWR